MSTGFGIFITVLVLANIGGALWLIWWTARGSGKVAPLQTTHVWDDDLTEYNNPLPRWWLWLFLLSILFGICYLVVYPGWAIFPASPIGPKCSSTAGGFGRTAGVGAALRGIQRQEPGRVVQESRCDVDGEEPVRPQLLRLPRVGRPGCQGVSQSHRSGLAVGRQRTDHLSNHCAGPRQRDARRGVPCSVTTASRTCLPTCSL